MKKRPISNQKFIAEQQRVIDENMKTMPPSQVNEILDDMSYKEAQGFLERLGHLRAKMIYDAQEE